MPFDPADLPPDTHHLIALRAALTPETWRPYPSDDRTADYGCIQQWLWRTRVSGSAELYDSAYRRLARAVPNGEPLTCYNDTHTLADMLALIDRAIANDAG